MVNDENTNYSDKIRNLSNSKESKMESLRKMKEELEKLKIASENKYDQEINNKINRLERDINSIENEIIYMDKIIKEYQDFQIAEEEREKALKELQEQKNKPIANIKADALIKEFKDNIVRAEEIFKDKTIVVTGYVYEIGKKDDFAYLSLQSGDRNAWPTFEKVRCYFHIEDKVGLNKIANLNKWDYVEIQAIVQGSSFGYVVVYNSKILE